MVSHQIAAKVVTAKHGQVRRTYFSNSSLWCAHWKCKKWVNHQIELWCFVTSMHPRFKSSTGWSHARSPGFPASGNTDVDSQLPMRTFIFSAGCKVLPILLNPIDKLAPGLHLDGVNPALQPFDNELKICPNKSYTCYDSWHGRATFVLDTQLAKLHYWIVSKKHVNMLSQHIDM